jgi:hypothetical protein
MLSMYRQIGRRADYFFDAEKDDRFEALKQISMLIEALLGMTPARISQSTTLQRREAMAGLALQLRALLRDFDVTDEELLKRAGTALQGIHVYLHNYAQATGGSMSSDTLVRAEAFFDVDWSSLLAHASGH